MGDDQVLCPDCGWSGPRERIEATDGVDSCPVCDTDVEFVE